MSHRVLARKYRPRTFAEVIGQEHIVRALSRAIERDRLGQAYLLIGPRGVGKTSTARILAKSLNCERGPTVEPCLACAACTEIENGGDVDVIEIDGASNNGVDDVRALRDRVHYRPLRDRLKVYIIDEVQRLSGPAFDALLKTLEEPPGHALFLFATTDPHKIPETIVSRCQVFEFRRLREVDVQAKLQSICEAEQAAVPAEVLAALARGCRGGLRDAESMLDQVLAVADGTPGLDDLEMVAGLARPERWLGLFEAVEAGEGPRILQAVEDFLERGGTERDFVEQAIEALRHLLHLVLLGEDALGVEPEPDRRARMMELAGRLGRDRLESLLGMLFQLDARMNQAPLAARALLEWTLLRGARLGELLGSAALIERLAAGGGAQAPPPLGAPAARPEPARAESADPPSPAPAAPPTEDPSPRSRRAVQELLAAARRERPTLGRILEEHFLEGRIEDGEVRLVLREPSADDRAVLEDPAELAFLQRQPGSPGAWRIEFPKPAERQADPLGDHIRDLFGAVEETP